MKGGLFVLTAFVPLITGPVPVERDGLTVELCGGGSVVIPIGDPDPQAPEPCSAKACHAGNCRKRF